MNRHGPFSLTTLLAQLQAWEAELRRVVSGLEKPSSTPTVYRYSGPNVFELDAHPGETIFCEGVERALTVVWLPAPSTQIEGARVSVSRGVGAYDLRIKARTGLISGATAIETSVAWTEQTFLCVNRPGSGWIVT